MPLPGYDHLADVVLLVMFGEWLALGRGGRGWAASAAALLPGALLVLALRAALAGTYGSALLLPLALSFPAHLIDLRTRGRPRQAEDRAVKSGSDRSIAVEI